MAENTPSRTRRIDAIKDTIPFGEITSRLKEIILEHFADPSLYGKEHKRVLCTIMGTLYEELADRPDLQDLVIEATWQSFHITGLTKMGPEMWDVLWNMNNKSPVEKKINRIPLL